MTRHIDIAIGERFTVVKGKKRLHYSLVKQMPGDQLVFVDELDGGLRTFSIAKFAGLRAEKKVEPHRVSPLSREIDIAALQDETTPGLSRRQVLHIKRKKANHYRALTLRFYVQKFDSSADSSRSTRSLDALRRLHYDDALGLGFVWQPSADRIRVAIRECGEPGDRPLAAFLKRPVPKASKWDEWHRQAKAVMIEKYWGSESVSEKEVINGFCVALVRENQARDQSRLNRDSARQEVDQEQKDDKVLEKVARETLRLWIVEAETYDRYCQKYGKRSADRKYAGRVPQPPASRPLERVQIDQTLADVFLNIHDEAGNVVARKRPWLVTIVDTCTRGFLAAILSFDPPSCYTLMAAVRQMLEPKRFLIEKYGTSKGATNFHGKPLLAVVDNGLENVNLTFQAFLAAAGIDLEIAPVYTPEAKPLVERSHDTLNKGLWHRAPGAVPFKPGVLRNRRMDPQEQAQWTLEYAQDVLWGYIVNVQHLTVKNAMEMAPARKWNELIEVHGRPVIYDMDLIEDLCGITKRAKLTAEGVSVDGMRFHEPEETTRLLKSMLPFAPKRTQRRSPDQTGVLEVDVIVYPDNCARICVADARSRRMVRLPNIKPRFATGLSWHWAKSIKKCNAAANLAFMSDDEAVLLRDNYIRDLRENGGPPDLRKAGRRNSTLPKPSTDSSASDRASLVVSVVDAEVAATVAGMAKFDIPHLTAAFERENSDPHHQMQRRGGRKAVVKRLQTKGPDRTLDSPTVSKSGFDGDFCDVAVTDESASHETSAYLDALADDLD